MSTGIRSSATTTSLCAGSPPIVSRFAGTGDPHARDLAHFWKKFAP
jgi:hypothetical protein